MEELIRSLERDDDDIDSGEAVFSPRITLSSLIQNSSLLLFSLLLGSFTPFEGMSPFGAAAVMASWYSGMNPLFACAGAVVGYCLAGNFAYAIVTLILGAAMRFAAVYWKIKRLFRLLLSFAAEAVLFLIISIPFRLSVVLLIGASTVSVLGAIIIGQGFHAMRSFIGGRALNDTEVFTLSAAASLLTLSMRSFTLFEQSPGMIFAGLCALFASYRLGTNAAAVAVTVGAGRVLAAGGSMYFIAELAAAALIAASLRSLGKWATLIAFIAVSAVFTYVLGGAGSFSFIELIIIGAVFALVPSRLYVTKKIRSDIENSLKPDPRFNLLQYRTASLSDVINELARVYGGETGRILGCISKTLRASLNAGSKTGSEPFTAEYGTARSAKPGSGLSGDSSIIKRFDSQLLLSISDGMGSGDAANKESRAALSLLSDLINVGFTLEDASECVNDLLARKSRGDMYATLDAMLIDLSNGQAKLSKNGAPPCYILRGGKVYTLYAEALPVGIIDSAKSTARSLRLRSGDTIIMMSDGVSDALGSYLISAITDNLYGVDDPVTAANTLLDLALAHGHSDDMTVIVARIEERAV